MKQAMHPAPEHVARVIAFFESITPQTLDQLASVYATDARFKDPFNDVRGLPAVRRVFDHMFVALRQPRFVRVLQAGIGQGGDDAAELGAGAPVSGAAEHPAAFLEALDQPGLTQKLEMTGDARLGLAHDLDQLADRQFGLAQQQEQAQPGGVAGGTQHGNQPVQVPSYI